MRSDGPRSALQPVLRYAADAARVMVVAPTPGLEDLVTLLCFYVNDGSVDEADFLCQVGACLPEGCRPTVNAVPVFSSTTVPNSQELNTVRTAWLRPASAGVS